MDEQLERMMTNGSDPCEIERRQIELDAAEEEDLSEYSLEKLINAYRYYHTWLKCYANNCFAGVRGQDGCDKIDQGEALLDEIERRLELLSDNGPNEEVLEGKGLRDIPDLPDPTEDEERSFYLTRKIPERKEDSEGFI